MVEHVTTTAASAGLDVILVGGPSALGDALGVPWLPDASGCVGPVAGLVAALRHTTSTGAIGVVLLGGDLPLFPVELFEAMAGEAVRKPNEALACQGIGGRLQTLGAYYPTSGLETVERVARGGSPSLRHVFEALPGRVVLADADLFSGLDLERAFLNVNTPADLIRAGEVED